MVCPPYQVPMTSQRLITAFTDLTPRRVRVGPRVDAEVIGVLASAVVRRLQAANEQRTSDSLGLAVGLCS